ncbi:hypothetical protein CVD28_00070 [Bacillus sp. M6-12]|uniref:DUF2325 domain-containing protein n=1 Tax=Bacillus sp. M6-12 TaxID=2054166 RepID=UPI000C75CA82|nr:DUF2325 domain-containing protein [Bacillus sp. M6-12]PLS18832.1 hypothetical protein CVD28_00070 [Bacillus sp. M6-12]
MIISYLEKRDFDLEGFLNELEKKELLFLLFLASQDDEVDFDRLYQGDDIDYFLRDMQRTIGGKLKKIPKEEIVEMIVSKFDISNLSNFVYRSIYQHTLDSDFILFHSKLQIIERFTSMMFSKKIHKIQEDLISGKLLNKKNVIDEFQKRILYQNRPILNTLGLVTLMGKIDYVLEHILDYSTIMIDFRDNNFCLLLDQFEEIEEKKRKEQESLLKKKEWALKKSEEEYRKKEDALSKAKESNKQLIGELKTLKKEWDTAKYQKKEKLQEDLINRLQADLQKKDKQLTQYEKDIEKIKKENQAFYTKSIDGYQQQLAVAKAVEKEKDHEITMLKRKMEHLESKTIETHVEEFIEISGFTETLYQYLEPFIEEYKRNKELEKKKVEEIQEPEEERMEQKVGYCLIENDIHYVVFADGSRIEINEIPENVYIGQWQFVKVQADGVFKWSYGYKFDENERDYLISDFGSVIYRNNEPYLMKAVWDTKKIEVHSLRIQLKENQVVSVNSRGQLLRFYRSFKHNANHYMDSIKAKGQVAYYVLKVFPNGLLVRNIETNVEEFKDIEIGEEQVQEQQILCVKENQIIHVYYSPKFYTFSHFYKKSEHGTVEIKDDIVFIRKLSGEVVIVNEIPEHFSFREGEVIIVDEFNNYMMIKKGEMVYSDTEERRILSASPKVSTYKKNSLKNIEVEKEILIVGKITYENTYKMSLYKSGYRAEVIDGYDPWTKIKSSIKDKDIVVVIGNFVSHDNMWKIKDEKLDIPVLYPEYDGANRIVEEIDKLVKKQSAG